MQTLDQIRIPTFLAMASLATACGADDTKEHSNIVIDTNANVRTDNSTRNVSPNVSPNATPNNGPNGTTNGSPNGSTNGNTNAGLNAGINANCPLKARPIYVVESDIDSFRSQGKLVRFEPPTRDFVEIGELNCPGGDDGPFSMSVDRDGIAWVLYQNGRLYRVDTEDASCESTDFATGQDGFDVFGMGFVLNNPTNDAETLFVAGGSGPGSGVAPKFGSLSFPDLVIEERGTIQGWPEMSGTAAAELWAFFPEPLAGDARVSRIAPATGEELEEIPVDSLIRGDAEAWAFAHWGGNFYLFYKEALDDSSNVFEVRRDGTIEEIINDSGRYIVGAGVSTCAPLIIQ